MKTLYTIILFLLISNIGYSQVDSLKKDSIQADTIQFKTLPYRTLQKVDIQKATGIPIRNSVNHTFKITPRPLYRPTRLGSSSPLYNTYKKNDYGAGAVTTNPHKSGRSFINESPIYTLDSLNREADSIHIKKD